MQEEIKEYILSQIENGYIDLSVYDEEEINYVKNAIINQDKITNLQQKIDQYENPDDYTLFYMWLDEKAKDKIKELQTTVNNCKQEIKKQ